MDLSDLQNHWTKIKPVHLIICVTALDLYYFSYYSADEQALARAPACWYFKDVNTVGGSKTGQ